MSHASALFKASVRAIREGEIIEREGRSDKEFHFQNWFGRQLNAIGVRYDSPGRNTYPDFRLVEFTRDTRSKGWPTRAEADYDCNSQVPCGQHNGRSVYYVFGRYPAAPDGNSYPVLDFVLCHGSFLNAATRIITRTRAFAIRQLRRDLVRDRKM